MASKTITTCDVCFTELPIDGGVHFTLSTAPPFTMVQNNTHFKNTYLNCDVCLVCYTGKFAKLLGIRVIK